MMSFVIIVLMVPFLRASQSQTPVEDRWGGDSHTLLMGAADGQLAAAEAERPLEGP